MEGQNFDEIDECLDDPTDQYNKEKIVIEYFKYLIPKQKRQITRETVNRYIFSLNKIWEMEQNNHKVLSMLDLKESFEKELECVYDWKIDKKTLRFILETLQEDGLIKIHQYKIILTPYQPEDSGSDHERTYESSSHIKLILSVPGVSSEDERVRNHQAI